MRPKALITETLDATCADWLAQRCDVTWNMGDLPGAEALVVRTYTLVNAELLARATKLRVVGRAGVGLDNIDLPACRARGVEVVYTPDANTQAVVEYVIALILDELRPRKFFTQPITAVEFHEQRKIQVGQHLADQTVGILGFGRIGKRLGKALHAVGVTQLRVNDLIPEAQLRPLVDYPFEFVDRDTLLRQSDIVTLHVDGRAENRHLLNAVELAKLKPSAVLLNAARGMLIDNPALASWAKSHPQSRIILDVHDPEPPPPEVEYPLYGISNVKLLPHLASRTHAALLNMSWVVRDVWAVLQGQAPQFPAP